MTRITPIRRYVAFACVVLGCTGCMLDGPHAKMTLTDEVTAIDEALDKGRPQIIVKGAPGVGRTELQQMIVERGGIPGSLYWQGDRAIGIMPNDAAVESLARDPRVAMVEKDDLRHIDGDAVTTGAACTPWPSCSDPTPKEETFRDDGEQYVPWGVARIGAPEAWRFASGYGVKVAVIDTGIDRRHPDLRVVGGVNVMRGADPEDWDDDNGHGTHVAGTIAALDNGTHVVGVAPDARLYAVKVLGKNGHGWTSDVIKGIRWSIAHGMQVINMSLGADAYSDALEEAVDDARDAGIFIAVASGNVGDADATTPEIEHPARSRATVAVGAMSYDDRLSWFSSDGPEMEVVAPGMRIRSTELGGSVAPSHGTSMATPHLAGAAAVLLSVDPDLDADCVRRLINDTAEDLGAPGWDPFFGYGLIDLSAAISAAGTGCR